MFESLKTTLLHPFSVLGALLVSLEGGIHLVGETANLWFPLVGVLSQLGGQIALIPAAVTDNLFIGAAVVYGSFMAVRLVRRVRSKT